MQTQTPHPATSEHAQETHKRFSRLQRLVHDDGYRQRVLFIASLLAFLIVGALAASVRLFQTLPFDLITTRELQEPRAAWFRELMIFVSAFGYMPWSAITVVVGTVLVGIALGWKDGALLLVATLVQGLANIGIKTAIGRVRPSDSLVDVARQASGNSFPSGHVMFYTVFFGMLCFLAWTRMPQSPLRWVAMALPGILVLLVGPSRIFLGAHWLSDVIAAYLLGFIFLGFTIEFYLRRRAPTAPAQQEGAIRAYDERRTTNDE